MTKAKGEEARARSMTPEELRNVTLGEIAAAVFAQAPSPAIEPARYTDIRESGVYRHALTAIDNGELPAFRLPGSRKLWVRTEDFERWIERADHRVGHVPIEVAAPPVDEIGEIIAMNESRRRKKRAANP